MIGVVIPVGPGREENLKQCARSLQDQTRRPDAVMLVHDGPDSDYGPEQEAGSLDVYDVRIPKHEPGQEQPRNVGVRELTAMAQANGRELNPVWFVDADVVLDPHALENLLKWWRPGRIVAGPYDWLPPEVRRPMPDLKNDPRWAMMNEKRWRDPEHSSTGELNVGLGCFSGNLLWDANEFRRVGGFWNEIHHGRCEDGELGLRAVAEGIPIAMCRDGRGWHLAHAVDAERTIRANERDVPMLNARHPWVEGEDVFVVQRDGRRFEERCVHCHKLVNTVEIWEHLADCRPDACSQVARPDCEHA